MSLAVYILCMPSVTTFIAFFYPASASGNFLFISKVFCQQSKGQKQVKYLFFQDWSSACIVADRVKTDKTLIAITCSPVSCMHKKLF